MYQQFFEEKQHVRIPSAPLVPEHDPSVLFTTAGMHPLVPYLKGQPHPQGKRLVNVQKCLRTTDIDDVGDATHATVFEMLGNWSLGDYFKREAIEWSWEFLTSKKWLGIGPQRLAVSVFAGDKDAPRDTESANIWKSVGVPPERIAYLNKKENWWPAGGGQVGPQGPDTEMFYWSDPTLPPEQFDPKDGRWVEIWNNVFMQFNLTEDDRYEPLAQHNVDTGMGLERTVMVLRGLPSIYEIDSFRELMRLIESETGRPDIRHQRIVADHIKAATFVLGDEHPSSPSRVDRGYVLRRVIRRAVRSARTLGVVDIVGLLDRGAQIVVEEFQEVYPSLARNQRTARSEMRQEVERFERVLEVGLKQFERMIQGKMSGETIDGRKAFILYERYGFPIELTEELAREHKLSVDIGAFEEAFAAHQRISREATKGKFAGGLADHSTKSIHYHTATHLLHRALRQILGDHVMQRGSNITQKRLRFDFSHPTKLTSEEISKVEGLVNEKIKADLPVSREEMTVAEAKGRGALGLFGHKYKDRVSVYTIGDFSVEICGGPHVEHTGELGHFKIMKEESAASGIRRIKAHLE